MSLDDELKKVLAGVTPKERELLKQKFGITLSDNPSVEELRALTSITREQIEAIEKKALKKLKDRGGPNEPK